MYEIQRITNSHMKHKSMIFYKEITMKMQSLQSTIFELILIEKKVFLIRIKCIFKIEILQKCHSLF